MFPPAQSRLVCTEPLGVLNWRLDSEGRVRLSFVVPVLDQEEGLEETIRSIRALPGGGESEVVVVFDVTRPEMLPAVKAKRARLAEAWGVGSIVREGRKGFGTALRDGARSSSGDVIVPVMADLSDDLGVVPEMVRMLEEGADIAVACRYMPGGHVIGDTTKQRLSRLYSRFVSLFSTVPCRDVSNSFKAYRRRLWETVPTRGTSFDLSVELTVKAAARGYRIAEVPATWTNRAAGQSSFAMLRELPAYCRWLLFAVTRMPSPLTIALGVGMSALVLATAARRRPRLRPSERTRTARHSVWEAL